MRVSELMVMLKEHEEEMNAPFREKNYIEWDNEDVCAWMKSIGMEQYVPHIVQSDINGAVSFAIFFSLPLSRFLTNPGIQKNAN